MFILELLRADGNLTTSKKIARAIGLHEAILYQELISRYIYFKDRNQLTDDGYFFNCIEDLEYATVLSDKQQRSCIKKLVELNLIFYKVKGIPAKRYFKINLDQNNLEKVIQTYSDSQLSQKGKTWIAEKEKTYVPKGQCNNTNNNTNLNNTKDIGNFDKQNPACTFQIFFQQSKTEIDDSVRDYIKLYDDCSGNVSYYTYDVWQEIVKNLSEYITFMERAEIQEIIERYFDTDFEYHTLYHSSLENVLKNRIYECGLM